MRNLLLINPYPYSLNLENKIVISDLIISLSSVKAPGKALLYENQEKAMEYRLISPKGTNFLDSFNLAIG